MRLQKRINLVTRSRAGFDPVGINVEQKRNLRTLLQSQFGMNPKLPLLLALQVSIGSLALGAEPPAPSDDVVVMKPYVVEERSLAKAGFGFKATFRHHMIWAGVKELIIVNVGPRSEAKKAGLEVGEKIIQIRDVKVDGLGIRALQKEFEKKSENGKIPLIIQSKDSEKTRLVELQFGEPAARPKQEVLPAP